MILWSVIARTATAMGLRTTLARQRLGSDSSDVQIDNPGGKSKSNTRKPEIGRPESMLMTPTKQAIVEGPYVILQMAGPRYSCGA